jgi:hypothetical protein
MGFVSLVELTWLNDSVFSKVMPHFSMALGDLAPSKLPKITQFVLWFHDSFYWELGLILSYLAMLLTWLVRPAFFVSLMGVLLLIWVIALPGVTFFSLWMGDMMIVKALASAAKAKGLMP